MSGTSSSVTFLLSHEAAASYSKLVEGHDEVVAATELGNEEEFLYATSRNNAMEYFLRALIKEYPGDGLAYFRLWDEIIDQPPWVIGLRGASLSSAIADLPGLLASLREQPAQCVFVYSGADSVTDVVQAASVPIPATFSEAHKAYDEYNRFRDGDDIYALVLFLHAHLLLLEQAQETDQSALYGLWLY